MLDKPAVMGIINVTPDSFYGGSRANADNALRMAEQMLKDGAAILDIGGQSTRPQSIKISADEEAARVLPVIEAVHKNFPETFISADTYYANVAHNAVQAGACIINDISGGLFDANMPATVALLNVPYICMHIKGNPQNMQQQAMYEDVTKEVLDFFISKTEECRLAGIHDLIIDPGFGFGKTIQHNFSLLKNLSAFAILQKPLLVGVSRKSTIYKTLGTTAEDALNGSTVLHTLALQNGANILRVHDVKEANEAIRLFTEYLKN